MNYIQFLDTAIHEGKLKIDPSVFTDTKVTYHDPCYLGRGNGIYDLPRSVLKKLTHNLVEMKRHKSFALCCGAGGGQMFKEAEKGDKEIYIERTEEALSTGADVIATACPFCMTMLTDGLKYKNKIDTVKNLDIAEMIAISLNL
jgi:Fe-S oxidoreductase